MNSSQIHTSEIHILVVDDTKADSFLLTTILSEKGYNVHSASDGVQALSSIQTHPPDLILLDVVMPEMSGHEVCEKLKADERSKDIPVIFISSSDQVTDKVRAFFVGGVDYVTKPFQTEEILARVETHLNVQRLQTLLQQKTEHLQQEIHEHTRTEESLKESEKRYRSIFENAPVGMFQASPDEKLLDANDTLAHMLGYTSARNVIESVTNIAEQLFVTPRHWYDITGMIRMTQEPVNVETKCRYQDGGQRIVFLSVWAVHDEQQCVRYFEGFIEDITERRQIERVLRRQESLLKGVAVAMNRLLIETNLKLAIIDTLEILGFVTGVSGISIFENHYHSETNRPLMSQRFNWAQELAEVQINESALQNLPYRGGYGSWYKTLSANEPLWGLIRNFPQSERSILEAQDILSILLVPVMADSQFWGFIEFDDCQTEHLWSEEEKSLLLATAAGIGGAITRQRGRDRLIAANDELAEALENLQHAQRQ